MVAMVTLSSISRDPARNPRGAFSIIELLVSVTIMSFLAVMALPALQGIKGAAAVTDSAYQIGATLQHARTYAMTHNTYVWVGFYEQKSGTDAATVSQPPYAGKGQVVLGIAASVDGTQIYDDTASPASLPASRIKPVGKLVRMENVHLTDVGGPSGAAAAESSLDARSSLPYNGAAGAAARISSDSSEATTFPMTLDGYTFYKTIRFAPSGEAAINGGASPQRMGEIGLRPTHGGTVDQQTPNVAAVQFTGIGGNVQIYRR